MSPISALADSPPNRPLRRVRYPSAGGGSARGRSSRFPPPPGRGHAICNARLLSPPSCGLEARQQ